MYETRELTIWIPAVVVPLQFMLFKHRLYRMKSMRDFLIWVYPQDRLMLGLRPHHPLRSTLLTTLFKAIVFSPFFFFSPNIFFSKERRQEERR
jgi:predicted secreted protein